MTPARSLGGFTLGNALGQGGAGTLFRGRAADGTPVAIKLLSKPADERSLERFRREAQALQQLNHPGVVRFVAAGEDLGRPYVVTELVEGEDLEERLRTQGPLDLDAVVALGRGLAEALHHAHGRGVLHRDLKPANVILGVDGAPVLVDFGLARQQAVGPSELSVSGLFLGTPGFAAPEQAKGDPARVGPATDVYGLGAVLYAALTGVPPAGGSTLLACLAATLQGSPPPPSEERPEVPAALDQVVLRCLAKDPADRYPSARAVLDALEDLGVSGRAGRASAWLAGAALVLVAGSSAAWLLAGPGGASPAERASSLAREGKLAEARGVLEAAAPGGDPVVLAEAWQAVGDDAEAERVLAASEADLDGRGWLLRAEGRLRSGDVGGAGAALEEARRRQGPEQQALRCEAGVAAAQGRAEEAESLLDRAVALAPDEPRARALRGELRALRGDLEGAQDDYDRALAGAPPRYLGLWTKRALVRIGLGDYEGAAADADVALTQESTSSALRLRGRARALLGQDPAARADMEAARQANRSDPSLALERGLVLKLAGDHDAARAALAEALELAPGDPFIALWLRACGGEVGQARGRGEPLWVARLVELPVSAWRASTPEQVCVVEALRGLHAEEAGDARAAVAHYEQAVAAGARLWWQHDFATRRLRDLRGSR
jgi:tetratricopeptide (TPR) repeat protein